MKPAEAAREARVPMSTLRYYERRELVVPQRHPRSGHRHYTDGDIQRVRFVQRAQQLGFGLADVTAFFALAERGTVPSPRLHSLVRAKLTDLDKRIDDLARMRDALSQLADGVADDDCECPVIEALASGD